MKSWQVGVGGQTLMLVSGLSRAFCATLRGGISDVLKTIGSCDERGDDLVLDRVSGRDHVLEFSPRRGSETAAQEDRSLSEAELERAAADLTDADVGDRVLPHFIAHRLPAGLAGLLIAAIVAAAMSSIDTSLNSSATVILSDFYKRHFDGAAGEGASMVVLRVATVAWGAFGTGVALAMIGSTSLLDAWWTLSGVFAGGMLGLFLLGIVVRGAGSAAAAIGVCLGVLLILWMTFSPNATSPAMPRSPFHKNLVIVFGTTTIFLVGLLASRFIPRGRLDTRP